MQNIERILIIKPSSFGDIVHLFPTLQLLNERLPGVSADFLIHPAFAPLLEFSPLPIRRKILFDRKALGKVTTFAKAAAALLRELRQEKYDLVIDYQGLFRSGLCTGLSRAKCKAGAASPREKSANWFYNRRIISPPAHAVERYVRMTEALFNWEKGDVPIPRLPVSAAGAAMLPELPPRYIVLLPGTRWESKRFPPALFRAIADELRRRDPGLHFVAAGSSSEAAIAGEIGSGVLNLAGQTSLPGLFELLRGSCAVIGNDSGPLHAAAALQKPVFGFYGPTDPALTGPWGSTATAISTDAGCNGCLKRVCPLPETLCHQLNVNHVCDIICNQISKETQL